MIYQRVGTNRPVLKVWMNRWVLVEDSPLSFLFSEGVSCREECGMLLSEHEGSAEIWPHFPGMHVILIIIRIQNIPWEAWSEVCRDHSHQSASQSLRKLS